MTATATPTPSDLSARHVEVLQIFLADFEEAAPNFSAERAAFSAAIAALSALPAAGGEAGEVTGTYGGRGMALVDLDKCPVGSKLYTTPQPSAAEPKCGHPHEANGAGYPECHCETVDDCPYPPPPDAAVGAQGDGAWVPVEPTHEMELALSDALASGDYSIGECLQRANAAAPAAGKGVDAQARELLAIEYERGELFDVATIIRRGNIPAGWKDDCIALRAIKAALTRQPVAGDGMKGEIWLRKSAAEQMQADAAGAWRLVLDAAAMSPGWNATSGTNLDRVLALLAAPADVGAQGDGLDDDVRHYINGLPEVALNLRAEGQKSRAEIVEGACRLIRRLDAPAAGKGVDDAMVERAAYYLPFGTGKDQIRSALEAALTRQPVAGDGLRFTDVAVDQFQSVMAAHGFTVPVRVISDAFRTTMLCPAARPADGGEEA